MHHTHTHTLQKDNDFKDRFKKIRKFSTTEAVLYTTLMHCNKMTLSCSLGTAGFIRECVRTFYVGMARKKNGSLTRNIQN